MLRNDLLRTPTSGKPMRRRRSGQREPDPLAASDSRSIGPGLMNVKRRSSNWEVSSSSREFRDPASASEMVFAGD